MAQAYSQDLRDRVTDAGTSARAAAERFGIGVAPAIVCVRRAREGERSARKHGEPQRSTLDPRGDYLLGLSAAEPDTTIAEMQARLLSEAGLSASVGTIWTFRPGRADLQKKTAHAAEQERPDV